MRHLAIGDIHGCAGALKALAAFVAFHPDDILVTLGDYVDRGPDSHAVVDWLIAMQRRLQLIPLRGNHEVIMLAARNSKNEFEAWLECGGDATLASYSPLEDAGRLADVPDEHWQFLEATRSWFEIDTHFFVHANAYPECALEDQPEYMLFWEKFKQPPPHESGKTMICGHTPQHSGVPLNIGHAVCIDTAVSKGGWLTCLDAGSGRYWQASEDGRTRTAFLD